LNSEEFDRHAFLEMTHHAAFHAAEQNRCAERKAGLHVDGGTGQGKVNDTADIFAAVFQGDFRADFARRKAVVAPVFRQSQFVLVGNPSQCAEGNPS
jgi:hypothetical protein